MPNNIIDDPLKNLDDVFTPDTRQAYFSGELDDYHHILSKIVLNNNIPVDVKQLFETAKNISLYSYFVYRFHQVSEMVAYSALELSLKDLYSKDNKSDEVPKSLGQLLFYAKRMKWLDNEYFEDLNASTKVGIQQSRRKQAEKEIKRYGEVKQDPIREITDGDFRDGINKSAAVDGLIYLTLHFRNELAHGSSMLHPNSITTLKKMARIINYIYRNY